MPASLALTDRARTYRDLHDALDTSRHDLCSATPSPDRYALVETHHALQLTWLSTHPDPIDARLDATESNGGMWDIALLVDLDTGQVHDLDARFGHLLDALPR